MFARLFPRLVVAACLVVTPATRAADMPPSDQWRMFDRDWSAGTRTAMGITGDARLTPTSITFDHRVTLKLRYLWEIAIPESAVQDKIRQFSLFEILDPKPQPIVNGNEFCGHPDGANALPLVRYLAVGLKQDNDLDWLLIYPYASERPPTDLSQAEGECYGLGYVRERSP
jgi:hypothetical protein